MKHIMLIGQPGVGKTTAANYLVEQYKYVKLSLADTLKEIAYILWPEAKQFKHRKNLQLLGQKIREIDPDIWIKILLRRFEHLDKMGIKVVVDDVRYPNEFYTLLAKGFLPIKITTTKRITRLLDRDGFLDYSTEKHESEDFIRYLRLKYEISNESEVSRLYETLNSIQESCSEAKKNGG